MGPSHTILGPVLLIRMSRDEKFNITGLWDAIELTDALGSQFRLLGAFGHLSGTQSTME
jgi:hypothetical protein